MLRQGTDANISSCIMRKLIHNLMDVIFTMKFVKYEGDIKMRSRSKRHNLKELLEGFMSMNVKQVKVTFEEGEYKKPEYGIKSLAVAAKRYVLPIDVHFIGGECYLVRRDM